MNEESLEAAIAAYGAQLQQVEMTLSAGLDPSQQADLLQLKEDITQLIELTEASLVSMKKSQLLASLEESCGLPVKPDAVNGSLDNEFAAFYTELGEPSGSSKDTNERENDGGPLKGEGEEENEDYDDGDGGDDALSGTRVRAPYRTTWGTLEYHNAMVVGREAADGDEAQVRVFYIYPTQRAMKPCSFFLEDKCRFEQCCRFSHGEVVYVSELREFLELDLSNLQEGSSCLARHEDGIWYPARIQDIDSGFYTVKFDSALLKGAVVEADGVIPPLRGEDLPSSDSDLDEDGDEAFAKVLDPPPASSSSSDFGGWEAHTRGIGSRLILKMGYEYGKGLGKNQEGRVEPVMAVVLPKGQSLDQCGELTQMRSRSRPAKGDAPKPGLKRKTKKPRAGGGGRHNVFDFLNRRLGDGQADRAASGGPPPAAAASSAETYRGGKGTKRSLNVKLFQAAERVSQTEREIQRLTESLNRRAGRDITVVTHLEEKLAAARRLLVQQKLQEESAQKEHRKADTHKKMTEF